MGDVLSAIFSGHHWLSIFTVIFFGTLLGAVRFGPVRFGAAGTLFVGLAVGAFIDLDPDVLRTLQNFGLGIFVYMLGLSAGETFIKGMKSQLTLMLGAALAILVAGGTAVIVGGLLGLGREVSVGVFAGSLTATPALAVAQQQTGSELPTVGYSLAYPVGIITAILVVNVMLRMNWKAKHDVDESTSKLFDMVRLQVNSDFTYSQLRERFGDQFTIFSVRREGEMKVAPDELDLKAGDTIRLLVTKAAKAEFVDAVGQVLPSQPFRNQRLILDQLHVSSNAVAGSSIESLKLYKTYGARVLRIRRGDEVLMARGEMHLSYGDQVDIILEQENHDSVRHFFGDSVRAYSQLNWLALAGGLALSVAVSLITIPIPGGIDFVLGTALGPLIVGMALGAIHRTGNIAWELPASINTSFQQMGLMLFLAAVGLNSSAAFLSTAFSVQGLLSMVLGATVVLFTFGAFFLYAWLIGKSTPRAIGGASGLLGQPAVVQYALGNSNDSRIMPGYTTTFAIALIVKVFLVPFLLI